MRCSRRVGDAAGLTTIEYAVLFVLIVVGALALWTRLGQSLNTAVGEGEQRFSAELSRSASSALQPQASNDALSLPPTAAPAAASARVTRPG